MQPATLSRRNSGGEVLGLSPSQVIPEQIWRVFTCFAFLGKFGWPFVMNLIFVVQYAKTLEKVSLCEPEMRA
jgi:hypothetical protein